MHTKTLKIGQHVNMTSGIYSTEGTVVEVTATGVTVRTAPNQGNSLLRFDATGKGLTAADGTHEEGPYHIDEIVNAEE